MNPDPSTTTRAAAPPPLNVAGKLAVAGLALEELRDGLRLPAEFGERRIVGHLVDLVAVAARLADSPGASPGYRTGVAGELVAHSLAVHREAFEAAAVNAAAAVLVEEAAGQLELMHRRLRAVTEALAATGSVPEVAARDLFDAAAGVGRWSRTIEVL